MSDKISLGIVIPTLNSADTIVNTLESVRPLRKKGATVVVVDSFSEDSTVDIAKHFNVEVLYEPKGNMYRAINTGLKGIKADWLTYINSDDLLYSDTVLTAFREDDLTSVDVLYGSIDYIDYLGRFLYCWRSAGPALAKQLVTVGIMPFAQQGLIFRKSVFDHLDGFNDKEFRFSADFDFVLRCFGSELNLHLVSQGRIGAFRVHADQISQKAAESMANEVQRSIAGQKKATTLRRHWLLMRFRLLNLESYLLRSLRKRYL